MPIANFRIVMNGGSPLREVSDDVETLLGYAARDFLASTVRLADRIHPDDADIAAMLFSRDASEGVASFNIRIRHADGGMRCICGHCVSEAGPNGNPVRLVTLQDSKSVHINGGDHRIPVNLRAVMECVDECVYFKDRSHVFREANQNYRQSICDADGRPREVVGLTDYDLFPEVQADRSYEVEKQIFAGMQLARETQESVDREGKKFWVETRKFPVKDDNGEIIGLFGITRDITDSMLAEQALRESRELFQLFIQHSPAALAMFDCDMRYLAVSRRWLEMHGLEGRDLVGHSHYEVMPEIPERWRESHMRALAGETVHAGEDYCQWRDGSIQWVSRELLPWRKGDGAIGGIIIFSEDITRQKQAEERLGLASRVFTHAAEGILISDADGTILEVNDAFTRITGYTREEVLGKNPRLLNSGRQSKEFFTEMWRDLMRKGQWFGEIWNRRKDGQIYPELLTISAVTDALGTTQQYVALFSDLTSIKEQEQKLAQIAHFDQLTGLPNRTLLADRLHQAMAQAHRRGRPVAIACLDLDNFRTVNDLHGHNTGDRLLTALAQRMKLVLREDDTLARLGGDEFVALLLELEDVESSRPVLTKLLEAASEPIQVDELRFQVTASLGVTFYPQVEDVDADQLLRQADQAMYHAKLEGKNRFHIFDPREDRSVRGYHEDIERIRHALHANEFVLYYQPKVNMSTGEILGAEALIRWLHPEAGMLLPVQFLPVIDGHPLAVELGEWVIDKSLTQMEIWRAQGLDIPVSANISAQQLQREDFVDRLRGLLAEHPRIEASKLELELLESSALQDVLLVSQVIRACGEMGVSFALDDFGTGYSTLTYLRHLPASILKVDQTFVRDMLDDPEDLTILEGVLGLANAFRRDAVAEGVETLEHGLMLLRMGCQVAQGYSIARPMPAAAMPSWAATWKPDPRWARAVPVAPADRPVLYSAVEHRAWIASIEAYLSGNRQIPPALDHGRCRFGAWLQGKESLGRGYLPTLREIDLLHRQVHETGAEILALKADGERSQAWKRLEDLHLLRDELVEKLEELAEVI